MIRLIRRMWAVNPTWGSPRTRLATDPETMLFSGASLDQWRLRGRDLHSLIADPMFIAPKKMDFRLKHSSPALDLGFKPIVLTGIGVRK